MVNEQVFGCQVRAASTASTSFAAPKRTGSSAGRPVSSSAASIAARASSSPSARVLSATAATRAGRDRQREPLVQLDELAQRRNRVRAAAGALDLRPAALVAEDEQVRDASVVEAERDAGVDRVQERALALDPEQLAAALSPLDDETLRGAREEVGHDGVDRDSPAGDHHARLAGRDEDRAHAAPPRLEVELARDGHLPDRAVGADGEDDRRVDGEVLAGRGRESAGGRRRSRSSTPRSAASARSSGSSARKTWRPFSTSRPCSTQAWRSSIHAGGK